MAGLSLKHVYKVYSGRNTQRKGLIKTLIKKIKKKDEVKPEVETRSGKFVAVKDFNMEIEDGEFIVFVGPSGCGKSTTIRMIAGLEDISGGELYIDGVLVNDVLPKERDIAMVFQNYALYPHMTVRQNIKFALKLRKLPVAKFDKDGNPVLAIDKRKIKQLKERLQAVEYDLDYAEDEEQKKMLEERKEGIEKDLRYYSETPVQAYSYKHMTKEAMDEKVNWAAKILGIEELLDNKPAEMSGGQRQRVALGRAMVRGPKVFLLDEPLSNLDAKLRASMRQEIVKLHKELKTTFIYVTHDQVEAMTMGTRIVVMKLGVIQQIDTPTNLYDFPDNKFVAGFIGTPQMNFMNVKIQKSGANLKTTFENGETNEFALSKLRTLEEGYLDGEEREVVLGIRGEHIKIADGKAKNKLVSVLSVKEILGNTTQLFLKLSPEGSDYIACVPERNDYASGDKVEITFDEKHIHLFDKDSEISIMKREIGNKA